MLLFVKRVGGGETDTSQGVGPVRGSRALSRPPTDRPRRPPLLNKSREAVAGMLAARLDANIPATAGCSRPATALSDGTVVEGS